MSASTQLPPLVRAIARAMPVILASGAMAVVIVGAKSCTPQKPPEPVCAVATDCAGLPHIDCVGDWACDGGQCTYSCAPEPSKCLTDKDCAGGEVCEITGPCPMCPVAGICDCWGTCVAAPPPPIGCTADSECGAGQRCDVVCYDCMPGAACPPCTGTCVDVPPPGCVSDQDCALGESCTKLICPAMPCTFDPATGESWCPPCYGQCEPTPPDTGSCATDADCAKGERCELIVCTNVWCDPASDAPCPASCKGYCEPIPDVQGCGSDADCSVGLVCEITCPECIQAPCPCIGTCVEPASPGCQADADCGDGEQCVKQICPMAPCKLDPATGATVCPPCYGVCEKLPTAPACVVTGCSGQLCAAQEMASTCEYKPEYACYAHAICAPDASGACGWQKTDAYVACVEGLQPGCLVSTDCATGEVCTNGACAPAPVKKCLVTGCSGQICASSPVITTCEAKPQYACYKSATCAVQANGTCGWTPSDALTKCLASAGAGSGALPQ